LLIDTLSVLINEASIRCAYDHHHNLHNIPIIINASAAAHCRTSQVLSDAVHPFHWHALNEIFAMFCQHCAHWTFLLRHLIVTILQLLQEIGKPNQFAGTYQRIICKAKKQKKSRQVKDDINIDLYPKGAVAELWLLVDSQNGNALLLCVCVRFSVSDEFSSQIQMQSSSLSSSSNNTYP